MVIEYRDATPSDVSMLARMHRQSVADECNEAIPSLSKCTAEIERLFGRECEAIVFGAAGVDMGYTLFQRESQGVFVRHFFVSRQHRRCGVGRSAMQWLLANAWGKPKRVRLAVHVDNEAGIAFWRSVGFTDWLIDMKLESEQTP